MNKKSIKVLVAICTILVNLVFGYMKLNYGLDSATVIKTIDGDTFHLQLTNGEKVKARLIGVDTPESVHPNKSKNTEEGREISRRVKELIPSGTKVKLEYDVEKKDRYGRHLVYMYVNINGSTVMLNEFLLKNGWAKIATFKPNTKYVEKFERLVK